MGTAHKAVDYLRITGWKSTKLTMSGHHRTASKGHLYDVLLAGRWWPVWLLDIGFLRNTGTLPFSPFKNKIYKK